MRSFIFFDTHPQNYCEDAPTKSGRRTKSAAAASTSTSRRRDKAPPTSRSSASGETVLSKNVRGFSDSEIRRFVKSYRKFSNPKSRCVCHHLCVCVFVIHPLMIFMVKHVKPHNYFGTIQTLMEWCTVMLCRERFLACLTA